MKNTIVIIVLLFLGFLFLTGGGRGYDVDINQSLNREKIKIAACPTCFEMAENINIDKYEIIKTASTAESIALLRDQKVDMILAGRTLKPDEPRMDGFLIKEGYSFLSDKEIVVYADQLKNQAIYTNLDVENIKSALLLEKIEWVDNIYDYLDKGIVITSWENTDYARAEIVHVMEESGERFKLSRQPTIYCPHICDQKAREIALLINRGL